MLEATAEFTIHTDEGSKMNIETDGKLGELKDRVKSAIDRRESGPLRVFNLRPEIRDWVQLSDNSMQSRL